MATQGNLLNIGLSKLAERICFYAIIFILILSNLLTVTSSSFQQSMYNFLSHIPIESFLKNSLVNHKQLLEQDTHRLQKQYQQLNAKWESHRAKTNAVSQRIVKRSVKNAAKNVSSVFGEAIPYLGTALIVSVTAADVVDACDTIRDLNEMATLMETETATGDENTVCGTQVPDIAEVVASVKQQLGTSINQAQTQTKESARNLYDAIGGTLYQLLNK